jgi:hypothetical protein
MPVRLVRGRDQRMAAYREREDYQPYRNLRDS